MVDYEAIRDEQLIERYNQLRATPSASTLRERISLFNELDRRNLLPRLINAEVKS